MDDPVEFPSNPTGDNLAAAHTPRDRATLGRMIGRQCDIILGFYKIFVDPATKVTGKRVIIREFLGCSRL